MGLKKGSTGLAGALFTSLAGQAPAYSVASGAALVMSTAGAAAPLTMLLTTLAVLTTVYAVYSMAKRYPHAASFYSYVEKVLGRPTGTVNGLVYLFYAVIGVGSVAVAFAYLGAQGIYAITGFEPNPFSFVFIPVALALIVALMGIKPSVWVQAILTLLEVSVLLLFVVISLLAHASALSLYPFSLSATFSSAPSSQLAAVAGGLVFSVTYFMGFETATQISEEAKDPKRSIPRGTLAATSVMGTLFVAVTYAIAVDAGYAQASVNAFVQSANSGLNPMYSWMEGYLGYPGLLVFAIITITSVFGCYLATLNAAARMLYGMAEEGVLPPWLSRTNSRGSPSGALLVLTPIAVLVIIAFYAVPYILGERGPMDLTYWAMDYSYAMDSLYYVISLLLVVIAAFFVSKWKPVVAVGGFILAITLYYTVTYPLALVVLVASLALVLIYAFRKGSDSSPPRRPEGRRSARVDGSRFPSSSPSLRRGRGLAHVAFLAGFSLTFKRRVYLADGQEPSAMKRSLKAKGIIGYQQGQ